MFLPITENPRPPSLKMGVGGRRSYDYYCKGESHPPPIFAESGGWGAASVILIVKGCFPPSLVEPGVGGKVGRRLEATAPRFRVFISYDDKQGGRASVGSVIIDEVDTVHNSNHS